MQSRPPIDTHAAVAVAATPEGAPALPPRVSWGAIIAGAVVALTIGLMLNTLGVAVGATAVDAVGGYAAGRLSGTADNTDAVLHGLGVWAIAFLVSAVLLGNAVTGAASTLSGAASGLVGGAARGAGSAASAVAGQADPQALADRARTALSGPSDPGRMTREQRGAVITSLLGRRVASGSLPDADRQRLNVLVAAEAGIPQQEAAQRVQAYEAEAQRTTREAEERARRAADAAATGAATAAFMAFATLLLGAVAAAFGARAGARHLFTIGGAARRRVRVSA